MSQPVNWLSLPAFSGEFAAQAFARFEDGQDRMRYSRQHTRMLRSWRKYHSRADDSGCDETEVNQGGEQGEVLLLSPNRYRRLIQDQLALVMQTPPDFQAEAVNTDPESQAQCALALGVLDQYKRTAHLEDIGVERSEVALVLGESYLHIRWDSSRGREVMVEDVQREDGSVEQRPVYEGDFVFSVRTRYNIAFDPTSPDRKRPRWWIVDEPVNRWDLIEEFGNDSEEIRTAIMGAAKYSAHLSDFKYEKNEYTHDDSIRVLWVYAERSRSCPEGRRALILDGKTVLLDGPLSEDRCGVFRLAPAEVIFKPEGHTSAFDGLPVASAYGAQVSTVLSNHASFGMQRILSAVAANVKATDVSRGLGLLEYDHYDKTNGVSVPEPKVAHLLQSPPELFTFAEMLKSELDTVMGGSPVTRGDPSATRGDSGSKAAMLFAAAQQVGSGFVRAKLRSDEEVATFIISSLRRHATVERITSIVGKGSSYTARKFTGDDLGKVSRVNVRQANPARDTFAGRMQLAEMMLGAKTPEEREFIQTLIYTGRIETANEDAEAERLLIERENEQLREGGDEMPVVKSSDDHMRHVQKHVACMNAPDIRLDPAASQRHEAHVQWHLEALTPGTPRFGGMAILAATGQRPFPALGSGGPGMPGAPQPQPPRMGAGGGPGGPQKPTSMDMSTGEPATPRMPQQPQIPGSGERVVLPVPEAPSLGAG